MNEQKKQSEWEWQWKNFSDDEKWLFLDWIFPQTFEDFQGKRVLDAGCGMGQHARFVAPYAKEIVGIDLNAAEVAAEQCKNFSNIKIIEGDIAKINFNEKFDVVYSVGVIHHTDNPDATFANLAQLTKPDGKTIVWVYSREGNFLNRTLVEDAKNVFLLKLPKPILAALSRITTALLYIPVFTIYFLPLKFLPYYEYFKNFRKLSFGRNNLNVFDKLNAPQTDFISGERIKKWFAENGYRDVRISAYRGVSWRGSGIKI